MDEVFRALDTGNDGALSRTELLSGWNKAFKTSLPDKEINEILNRIDVNGDGVIEYSGKWIELCPNFILTRVHHGYP